MNQRFRFMLNCQDTAQLLSDSMDRKLSLYARFRIHAHLRICRLCQAYQQQLHLLRDLLRKSPAELIDSEDSIPPGLSAEAKRRIIRAINSLIQARPHP
jgi:predicted anti-sigma-YlaC factor YlaD